MKSIRSILAIVCSALLVFSLASAQADTPAPQPERVSMSDLHIDDLNLGAPLDEAAAKFPQYRHEQTETVDDTTGETKTYWDYTGLRLTFDNDKKLTNVVVSDEKIVGPRGLVVGMPIEEVVKLFPREDTGSSSIFYTSGYVEETKSQLPPCGFVIRTAAGTIILAFLFPIEPYGDDVKENPEEYASKNTGQLYININKEGKVVSYSMHTGPYKR